MRRKLSCTIIAWNEADRIARCLESVRDIADEIVVVDSGSTDDTLAICARFGARCLHNDWVGYGQQKRFAEDACSHDWVLNLDADEWLTEEARREVRDLLDQPARPEVHGYQFKIRHVYPGHDKPRPFADYHLYIRLYDRTRCRFPDSAVFDAIHLRKKNTGVIRGAIFHQSIRSVSHLIEKNVRYYRLQTKEVSKNPYLVLIRMLFEPFVIFIKYYIFRRHFTGGLYGFKIASTIAYLRTYRLALMSPLNRRS